MDAMELEWWAVALRIGGAALLGGVIGVEREVDGQDAGFRTHLLLAVGAALFGIVSVSAFGEFTAERAASNVQIDVTRIASYVAAGVGFIGGGAILKSGGSVRGITTASSLWATAAVGLAAGLGFWSGAVSAAVVVLLALAGLKPLSRWFRERFVSEGEIAMVLERHADLAGVIAEIEGAAKKRLRRMLIGREELDGVIEIEVQFWGRLDHDALAKVIDRLGDRDDVISLRVGT